MEFLVRFVQLHEPFRRAELEALAELTGVELRVIEYHVNVSSFWQTPPLPDCCAAVVVSSFRPDVC